jgi:hypothetical protein
LGACVGVACLGGCFFAVARAGVLAEVFLEGLAVLRLGALVFLFTGARLVLDAATLAAADRAVLATVVLAFVALRTGAFFVVGRLASGLGRADFALNLRFFADGAGEALRVVGREAGLLTPLMIGSLMRSYSVIKMTHRRSHNARSLTQPVRINQRNRIVCGHNHDGYLVNNR